MTSLPKSFQTAYFNDATSLQSPTTSTFSSIDARRNKSYKAVDETRVVNRLQTTKRIQTELNMSNPLLQDHVDVVNQLSPKYNINPLSVISSSSIRTRTTSSITHLNGASTDDKPALVLLYARTAEAVKLITIVEQVKRLLAESGSKWYQYNQLFDSNTEEEKKREKERIEKTELHKGRHEDDDDDDDDFETMQDRFTRAVVPQPAERKIKSMRIFLSIVPVPELKLKENVTVQSSEA